MPEMIPKTFIWGPPSERKVFSWLERSTLSGFVIHSIKYESPRQHEVDFVIISRRGVLILEVKGGYVTWNRQERWASTDWHNVKHQCENPYEQAWENKNNLQNKVKEALPGLDSSKILWACGVIFPDMDFLPATVEAKKEITLLSIDNSEEIKGFCNSCFDYALQKVFDGVSPKGFAVLGDEQISKLKEYFCGNAGILRDLKKDIELTEERIIVATQEQYKVLKLLDETDRFIVRGGAGTGKTLLALQHAISLSDKGLRVLFLTYNKLLKEFLASEGRHEGIEFNNFDRLIYEAVNSGEDDSDERKSWKEMSSEESQQACNVNRPNAFIRQGGLSGSRRYDAVIVDEAQDVISLKRRLQCIDLMAKGGLAKGKVYLFYDAAQHIFKTGEDDELEESLELLKNTYHYFTAPLSTNCRNTAQIAEFARLATGFGDPPDDTAIRSSSTIEASYYSSNEEKADRIISILRDLKGKGIKGGDILILSHRGSGNANSSLSCTELFKEVFQVDELDPDIEFEYREDSVKTSNIYRYKGLQEKIVIVTDVERLETDDGRSQKENYACFTRAKAKLFIVAHSELQPRIDAIIERCKNA